MGLLDDVIRDARRPLPRSRTAPAAPFRVQREALPEAEENMTVDAPSPAAPIEEQDDGRWTIYRFQEVADGQATMPPPAKASSSARSSPMRGESRDDGTDPPLVREDPGSDRSGFRHPLVVRTGGERVDDQCAEVTEAWRSGLATDESESQLRSPFGITGQPVPSRSVSVPVSSVKSSDPAPDTDSASPDDFPSSRTVESFTQVHVEEQRRPPGPGAPPESSVETRPPADDVRAGMRPAGGESLSADAMPMNHMQEPAVPGTADGVHIGFLEVQVIDTQERPRPAPPAWRQDVARRRYWKRF